MRNMAVQATQLDDLPDALLTLIAEGVDTQDRCLPVLPIYTRTAPYTQGNTVTA